MSGFGKDQLRALVKARKRPLCEKLGQLPPVLCDALLAFYETNRHKSILAEVAADRAGRKLEVENSAYLSAAYGQVALQGLPAGAEDVRKNYVTPLDGALGEGISALVGPSYRMRLSCLAPGGAIPRHVDDPGQLRVIAVLSGSHSFTFHLKAGPQILPMARGELWLVNTAFEHEVTNEGDHDRVALLVNLFQLPSGTEAKSTTEATVA